MRHQRTRWIAGLWLLGCTATPPSEDGGSTGSTGSTSPGQPSPGLDSSTGVPTPGTSSSGLPDTDTPTSTGLDTSTGASSESTDTGASSSSGEPPMGVTVEGEVTDVFLQSFIPGAQLSLYDDPTVTTTADASGLFSLDGVPAGALARLVVDPTSDYWGTVYPTDIGPGPVRIGIEVPQISTEVVDIQLSALAPQMPAPLDPTQALVLVRLIQNTATGATIDMDPPPAPGTYYAPDINGQPVLDQNLIEWPLYPVMVFFNVAPSNPGDLMITATHPERECTLLDPEFPTLGEHMTLVEVDCPPP